MKNDNIHKSFNNNDLCWCIASVENNIEHNINQFKRENITYKGMPIIMITMAIDSIELYEFIANSHKNGTVLILRRYSSSAINPLEIFKNMYLHEIKMSNNEYKLIFKNKSNK